MAAIQSIYKLQTEGKELTKGQIANKIKEYKLALPSSQEKYIRQYVDNQVNADRQRYKLDPFLTAYMDVLQRITYSPENFPKVQERVAQMKRGIGGLTAAGSAAAAATGAQGNVPSSK